jgi:hypothetical protein
MRSLLFHEFEWGEAIFSGGIKFLTCLLAGRPGRFGVTASSDIEASVWTMSSPTNVCRIRIILPVASSFVIGCPYDFPL